MKILSNELKEYSKSEAIAPEFSTLSTYAVGDAVMHESIRYSCISAISTAGAWNPSYWTSENVQAAIENAGARITMRVYDED